MGNTIQIPSKKYCRLQVQMAGGHAPCQKSAKPPTEVGREGILGEDQDKNWDDNGVQRAKEADLVHHQL